jgi:hypothetical protein
MTRSMWCVDHAWTYCKRNVFDLWWLHGHSNATVSIIFSTTCFGWLILQSSGSHITVGFKQHKTSRPKQRISVVNFNSYSVWSSFNDGDDDDNSNNNSTIWNNNQVTKISYSVSVKGRFLFKTLFFLWICIIPDDCYRRHPKHVVVNITNRWYCVVLLGPCDWYIFDKHRGMITPEWMYLR